jgi:hypothetical protein
MSNPLSSKSVIGSLLCASLMVGCGGSSDNQSTSTTTTPPVVDTTVVVQKTLLVKPSLGKIKNATVMLKNALTGIKIDEKNTGDTGEVSFNVASDVTWVMVEVIANANTTYFDEETSTDALGQVVFKSIPTGTVLRSAANLVKTDSELAVTLFTEAAVQRAEAMKAANGGTFTEHFIEAKALLEVMFNIPNILKAPVVVDSLKQLASLNIASDRWAELYALRLAVLAKIAHNQLGNSEQVPALAIAKALSQDLLDGNIDGSGNNSQLPYNVATLSADYQAQAVALLNKLIADAASNSEYDVSRLKVSLEFIEKNKWAVNLNPLACDVQPSNPELLMTGVDTICHFKNSMEYRLANNRYQFDSVNGGHLFITLNEAGTEIEGASFYPLGQGVGFACSNVTNSTNTCQGMSFSGTDGDKTFSFTNTPFKRASTEQAIIVQGAITAKYSLLCGYLPVLKLSDLVNTYAKNYSIQLYSMQDGAEVLDKSSMLSLSESGYLTLEGMVRPVTAVCDSNLNIPNVSGMLALIDNDVNHGISFVSTQNAKLVSGIDFSSSTQTRFFRTSSGSTNP